jgi:hypothetical protein
VKIPHPLNVVMPIAVYKSQVATRYIAWRLLAWICLVVDFLFQSAFIAVLSIKNASGRIVIYNQLEALKDTTKRPELS